MLTDKQKLQFLEKLLKENPQIQKEFEKYKDIIENAKKINDYDFERLVENIFYQIEGIDTEDFISFECYYDYDGMYDEVLEDIMGSFRLKAFEILENQTVYDTIFYLLAISEALLKEPNIADDMYILGDDYLYAFTNYLEKEIIK